MKLQAASATLPLLDWRVLKEPKTRIPSIDPRSLGEQPFLKGFGGFGERSTVSIPWRKSETVFFHANRAIRLPSQIPGDNPVQKVLRRVYIDGAQVRFDLAAFAALQPERLLASWYRSAAHQWCSDQLQIKNVAGWFRFPLEEALYRLATRFEELTNLGVAGTPPTSGISVLRCQVLMVYVAWRREIPPTAVSVLEDPPVWYLYDSSTLESEGPDFGFIFVLEDAFPRMNVEGFSTLRRLRRELTWLHADMQFLIEVGRAVERHDDRVNTSVLETARTVANGLSQLDQNEERGFSPVLFAAWSKARAAMLDSLRKEPWIGLKVPLPQWLTSQVQHGPDERRRAYNYTLRDSLNSVVNDYPRSSALQLGYLELVDNRLLDGEAPSEYLKERSSVFATYLKLPKHERIKISIVVPIRGTFFPVAACIDSLAQQILVRECPEDVEILLVEDGTPDPANPVLESDVIRQLLIPMSKNNVSVRRFVLNINKGRGTARNVGIFNAKGEIIAFIDASMVLDSRHLIEHVIRHHRIPNIALLGFKENLTLPRYTLESCRSKLFELGREPDARKDWKWHHIINEDDLDENEQFRFRSNRFHKGQGINYMLLTDWLLGFDAQEHIGPRSLATFFQTNIVSVPIWPVRQCGGFHRPFNDTLWGLEDSHLGALLLANGIKFVPCPSAIAFKIEHDETAEQRRFDLKRHRKLYDELLGERVRHRAHEAQEEIQELKNRGVLKELEPLNE